MAPTLSLIIPTLNPIPWDLPFAQSFQSLQKTFPELELIVIDSGSRPDEINSHRQLATKFLTIPKEEFDHGGTRHFAATQARGSILIFMTQDALLTSPDSVKHLLQPFAGDPKCAVSYGRQLPRPNASPIEEFSRLQNYPPLSEVKAIGGTKPQNLRTFFASNVFSAYRKDRYFEAGGFPKKAIMNEDMLINFRLLNQGYTCHYVADATVIHSHDYSLNQQFRRYFDIGVSLRSNWPLFKNVKRSGDGWRFSRALQNYLWKKRKYGQVVRSVLDIGARGMGFYLGLYHHHLPRTLKPRLSMHQGYWNSAQT